jgi:hypothetical protein
MNDELRTYLEGLEERVVERLEASIDEKLDTRFSEFAHVVKRRFDSVDLQLNTILDTIGEQFNEHDARFARIEQHVSLPSVS